MYCKYIFISKRQAAQNDLIETYWNVNFYYESYDDALSNDLIETYWNVNLFRSHLLSWQEADLIETYWNVNERQAVAGSVGGERFNRDILECKFER